MLGKQGMCIWKAIVSLRLSSFNCTAADVWSGGTYSTFEMEPGEAVVLQDLSSTHKKHAIYLTMAVVRNVELIGLYLF